MYNFTKKYQLKTFFSIILFLTSISVFAQSGSTVKLGLLKYGGGGDWYANPTSLPNLAMFCNENLNMNISSDIQEVDPGSPQIFNYPFIHITGHGNMVFSSQEVRNMRTYLQSGGFLHVSDNYGLDKFIRREMKKVFPELDFVELPFTHPIYHQKYDFPNGLPKVHEHDNKTPQGFALIYEGRVVCFYDYETDLGDGWEDESVHNDPYEIRLKALMMGANIVSYALTE